MSFYTNEELKEIGFKYVGRNVKISKKSSFYNVKNISIGDNTRIDDFCVISAGTGGIKIGKNVHIAVYCSFIGEGSIILEDFSGTSSRVAIYSSNDDYSGDYLTNPTLPAIYTNVTVGDVILKKHALIGAGSIVLPNVVIDEGAAVASLSLINNNCEAFYIYAGVPAKKLKARSKKLLEFEEKYLTEY
ncbi:acyltransferase [Chryseomicrobium sp. FSL W7-1435]|uniref:acyltransferase n=1 Tax=Chryseomicrobium sp. FSL W7-1435 TaxID=2921704 RepID=UPI00315A9366